MDRLRTAGEIRHKVHQKLLAARNLFTLVNGPRFISAWSTANENQKSTIMDLVDSGEATKLSIYIRNVLHDSLGNMNVRELRRLAQQCGIRGYNTLPKASLLSALVGTENESSNSTSRRDDAPITGRESLEAETSTLESKSGSVG